MKIALIGATGFIGSKLLQEALDRGHQVSALVQHIDKLPHHERLTPVAADVQNADALATQLAGHDAVISAFSGHAQGEKVFDYFLAGVKAIIAATKQAGVPRLLMVGGAGSLEVAPGVQLLDTPEFPAQWKGTAEGARQALNLLRQEQTLAWTMLSPAAMIAPGERTGRFRLGGDQLVVDAQGNSNISVEDYAVALLDELETPQHTGARFTLGY
ncbi:NAD(P)-dependent oxidoreductase [Chitiniphilus eburneus]|uniref:NAD(P)-dependent oxidoreductase n=1 Tax=Chitiniphilus eburneus TaxID=2571148 RepID=A0A4U0Q5F0_9NEIS|nr:NAD(P)-dependent oxidoreductase [Chitiniphilus eburneus]TJZ76309.1 NAD(P)-dependent oxidoreductase [Chitiniphilus eburneus]